MHGYDKGPLESLPMAVGIMEVIGGHALTKRFRAVYQRGAFLLQEPCDLPEGSRVELAIQGSVIQAPKVCDPVERELRMKALLERMRSNPIPAQAPRLALDVLHDRS